MNKLLVAAAGIALALVAVVALGGFRGRFHSHDPAAMAAFVNHRVDDTLDDLDATPAQRTQMHALVDKVIADAQKTRAGREQAHQALVDQWDAATVDRAQVHAIVNQQMDAIRAMANEIADAAVDAHGILTPPQRAKISKKIHRHMGAQ